jgi:hypothetical protein
MSMDQAERVEVVKEAQNRSETAAEHLARRAPGKQLKEGHCSRHWCFSSRLPNQAIRAGLAHRVLVVLGAEEARNLHRESEPDRPDLGPSQEDEEAGEADLYEPGDSD